MDNDSSKGLKELKRLKSSQRAGRPPLKARLSYRFDNIMTRGMVAKVGLLLGFTLLCVLVAGLIIAIFSRSMGIRSSVWQSFLHVIDPGTIAGDSGGVLYLFVMFVITIFGLLFTGTLIGILNNGMEEKMESLAKGKSHVLERGHTVVLGYNDVTLSILGELMEANRNHPRVPVLVMDQVKAVEMECEVRNRLGYDKHTKFIFRTGCTYDFDDLDICSLCDCKSIIVNEEDDFDTIKSILACKGKLDQYVAEDKLHRDIYITAVIRHEENELEARLAGGWRLKLIVYPRIMAKIIAGAGRQPGLSYVYTELFNYEGNEIYCDNINPDYGLTGDVTIFDINQHMEDTIVLGGIPKTYMEELNQIRYREDMEIRTDEDQGNDQTFTFPAFPATTRFKDFGKFFVLEMDDDPIKILPPDMNNHRIKTEQIRDREVPDSSPVKIVILGISPMLGQILKELDGYYAGMNKMAEVVIADDADDDDADDNEEIHSEKYGLEEHVPFDSLIVTYRSNVDVYSYKVLDHILDDSVTSIMLLTEDMDDPAKEDEDVLMQLIYLREIRRRHGYDFNITSEMNLDRNRELAELTGRSDFVVGSRVTAQIMTQISEYHELFEFFEEILSNTGSEIYMHEAKTYLRFKENSIKTDFYTLTEAAAHRQEVLIGIQKLKNRNFWSGNHEYEEPVLNPPKWEADSNGVKHLIEYELLPDDLLVVISQS